jgi:HK97 family phage major capsid protein
MNKKRLLKMLKEKAARKAELLTKAESTEEVKELRSINVEISEVTKDIADLKSMIEAIEAEERAAASADPEAEPENKDDEGGDAPEERNAAPEVRHVLGTYGMGQASNVEIRKETLKLYEQRGADLKKGKAIVVPIEMSAEERAVTVASSNLVIQKKYSNTMSGAFNEVSSLIDKVDAVPLIGGESYTKGFEVSFGEGDYTTETGAYTDTDPTTNYVEIGKAKITAYTEITDEAQKLPNVDYLALVVKNVRIAIRKKITKQLILGAGGSNAITGIFNAPTKVIPTASDLEVSEIDADTLDTIVFGYGGDEDVEGGAYLILNKTDLAAFAAVRLTDGKKAYRIKLETAGNAGTISSEGSFEVPFILNSGCPALSLVATAADTYCMAYGKLMAYEMPIFSQLTVEESRDFKFSTGQIAYRGAIWAGGNVVKYNGFVRIKKVAAV